MDVDVRVIDDALPAADFQRLSAYVRGLPYRHGWKAHAKSPTAHWNALLTSISDQASRVAVEDSLQVHPPVAAAWATVARSYLPGARVMRAYANLMTYGQDGFPHRDSLDEHDVTAMFYINEVWKPEWAGETCFFDESGDTDRAVLPRPNRLVIFPARVLHVARGVYPVTPDPRVVLVFKATFLPEGTLV